MPHWTIPFPLDASIIQQRWEARKPDFRPNMGEMGDFPRWGVYYRNISPYFFNYLPFSPNGLQIY
jgi:hypothetical protein